MVVTVEVEIGIFIAVNFLYLFYRACAMIIERKDNEVIIRLPGNVDIDDLQEMVNYARYKELTSNMNEVSQEEVDELASDVNKNWWAKNRDRLIK